MHRDIIYRSMIWNSYENFALWRIHDFWDVTNTRKGRCMSQLFRWPWTNRRIPHTFRSLSPWKYLEYVKYIYYKICAKLCSDILRIASYKNQTKVQSTQMSGFFGIFGPFHIFYSSKSLQIQWICGYSILRYVCQIWSRRVIWLWRKSHLCKGTVMYKGMVKHCNESRAHGITL